MATDWKDLLSTFDTVLPPDKRENGDLGYKKSLKEDPAGFAFRPDCCIVFTDVEALAQKFLVPREEVLETINGFIKQSRALGNDRFLIDISSPELKHYIAVDRTPSAYHKCLYDVCRSNHWETDIRTSLMIIGGNDVIAVKQHVFDIDMLDMLADIDLWYCFPEGFDLIDEMGRYVTNHPTANQDSLYTYFVSCARFNVSRLPLPIGAISTPNALQDYLGQYFNKVGVHGRMPVDGVCMATAKQFKEASACMSQGLPLVTELADLAYSEKGVYQSPYVNVSRDSVVNSPVRSYLNDLHRSDLLFFNVHGSEGYNDSAYYGNEIAGQTYVAFDTHLQNQLSNKLILSCACFGARYYNYSIERSILLTALYNSSTITFAGSSTYAIGGPSSDPDIACTYSETFLRVFYDHILRGEPVGEAFMRAKLDYLCHYYLVENLKITHFTISEFNLFGDPMCRYEGRGYRQEFIRPDLSMLSQRVKALSYTDAVYEAVRGAVDSAMEDIAELLKKQLSTRYFLNDIKLKTIQKKMVKGKEQGLKFCYSYNWGQEGFVVATTDNDGKLNGLYYSK